MPPQIEPKSIDVWFQDEARFGQHNSLSRTWSEKGSRPGLVRQQQYEYAYLFGAVCPVQNKAIGLILPQVNTHAMTLHLNEISKATPEGRYAVVIMDQAGWHLSGHLARYENLMAVHLPPYSPELNSSEALWKWLRLHELANRCFTGYDDIVEVCAKAWNKMCAVPNLLKTLCSRDWAVIQ